MKIELVIILLRALSGQRKATKRWDFNENERGAFSCKKDNKSAQEKCNSYKIEQGIESSGVLFITTVEHRFEIKRQVKNSLEVWKENLRESNEILREIERNSESFSRKDPLKFAMFTCSFGVSPPNSVQMFRSINWNCRLGIRSLKSFRISSFYFQFHCLLPRSIKHNVYLRLKCLIHD